MPTTLTELKPPSTALLDIDMMRAGFDALSEGILIFDRAHRVVYANSAAGRLLYATSDELIGALHTHWRPVDLAGNEIAESDRTVSRVLVSGVPVNDQVIGHECGTARRWLRTNARPLFKESVVTHVIVSFSDVTDSRSVSETLQAGETLNRQLMGALADGVFVAQDFKFVFANPALASMLGYTETTFAGTPFNVVLAPDHYGAWMARYVKRIGAGPEPHRNYETCFLKADGKTRVDFELVATRTRYGGRPAVLGVVRDISERKQSAAELERYRQRLEELVQERTNEWREARDALRESETFAQNVTDGLPALMAYIDSNRRVRFANDAWLKWFGHERDQALGRYLGELLPGDVLRKDEESILRALAGEFVETSDELTSARGQTHFFRIARRPDVRDGVVRGFHMMANDISELRRSEHGLKVANAALADAEQFTRSIADNLPVRIAYWDRQLRCRFVNRAYCEFYGIRPDALLGRAHGDIFNDLQLPERLQNLQTALAGKPLEFEGEELDRHGETARHDIHLIPDTHGDMVRGVFVLAIDVTTRQRNQVALQQLNEALVLARDKAESSVKAKSAFLANMSHEIRTPMNAIIGLTHTLKRDTRDARSGERLQRISNAAQHLLEIINDILDLSKIEAGKGTIEATAFDLDKMLARSCALVAEQARAKNLQLLLQTGDLPVHAVGDAMRISQALVNLLGNAVKFTERGTIELNASVVRQTHEATFVRFEVRDTGIGIPEDRLSSLFNAFEQADTSTTRRYGGTGLGLALTRHLAQLMGGDAGASSEPGVGSCFWITVSLAHDASTVNAPNGGLRVPQAAVSMLEDEAMDDTRLSSFTDADRMAEDELRQRHSGALVLLAEDNIVNQEVAVVLLTAAGLTVEVASDGRQAVEMNAAAHYDLVLMDMQMPEIDGLEACRIIRRDPKHARLPIVAMTANAFTEDRAAVFAAGMNDHIAKPVDPAVLYRTVSRWLDHAAEVRSKARSQAATARLDRVAATSGVDVRLASVSVSALPPMLAYLDGVEGLDVNRGLGFFAGRAVHYRHALGEFVRLYAQGLAIDAGDLVAVGREVHGIGSACASVGAVALAAEAQALMHAVRAQQMPASQIEPAVRAFSSHLARLCSAISARTIANT